MGTGHAVAICCVRPVGIGPRDEFSAGAAADGSIGGGLLAVHSQPGRIVERDAAPRTLQRHRPCPDLAGAALQTRHVVRRARHRQDARSAVPIGATPIRRRRRPAVGGETGRGLWRSTLRMRKNDFHDVHFRTRAAESGPRASPAGVARSRLDLVPRFAREGCRRSPLHGVVPETSAAMPGPEGGLPDLSRRPGCFRLDRKHGHHAACAEADLAEMPPPSPVQARPAVIAKELTADGR